MPKDTHRTATTDPTQLELPEQVTLAVAELAGAAREGLLALAVGLGLQVLQRLMAEDVARLVGRKGQHNPGPGGGPPRQPAWPGDPGWPAGPGPPPAGRLRRRHP